MMRRLAFLVFIGFGLIQTQALAEVAGEVTFASGEVRVGKLAGASVGVGTRINEGDALTTGPNGHLHIKLADQGLLILRPNSSAVVSDYVFNPDHPSQARMRILVSNGVVRSVTGGWAKAAPGQFRLNTPVAALGVRGTDFTVFTDQSTTRASVSSGGIVMAPLGASCSAQGLGPCEGALSAELFAGNQKLVLQAKVGGAKPEILDGRKLGIQPDTTNPPSPQEPSAGPTGKASQLLYPTNLETHTAGALDARAESSLLPAPAALPAPVPPPVPVQIKWGRWEKLLDPNNADDIRVDRTRVAVNAKFALFRDKSPSFIMPLEGTASFRLANQDSFFYDAAANRTTPATIENARFSVDFGARTFAADFAMRSGTLNTDISAKGGLFPDGRFISNAISSNASVSGALAGANASQGGFLFHRPVGVGVTAYGATYWVR